MTDDQTTEDARISNATKTDVTDDTDHLGGADNMINVDHVPDAGNLIDTPDPDEPKTFDEAYVKDLRDEAAKYRTRAKDRDTLAQRLHTALVAATGKLADPTDLPFDTAHLEDDGVRLAQAIDDLLSSKPHLAARKVSGDVGQGRNSPSSFSLLDAMKGIR